MQQPKKRVNCQARHTNNNRRIPDVDKYMLCPVVWSTNPVGQKHGAARRGVRLWSHVLAQGEGRGAPVERVRRLRRSRARTRVRHLPQRVSLTSMLNPELPSSDPNRRVSLTSVLNSVRCGLDKGG